MKKLDSPMREFKKSQEIFHEYLIHARRRWHFLILIALVGLFSALIPKEMPDRSPFQKTIPLLASIKQERALDLSQSELFHAWLSNNPAKSINQIDLKILTLGEQLEELGPSARELSFFNFGPEIDSFLFAIEELRASSLPEKFEDWSWENLCNFGLVLSDFQIPEYIIQNIQKAKDSIEKLIPVVSQDSLKKQLHASKKALETLELPNFYRIVSNLDEFSILTSQAENFRKLGDYLEEVGFNELKPLITAINAEKAANALEQGAFVVFGFNIPQALFQILLPLLAMALSVEIWSILKQTRAWSLDNLTYAERLTQLNLFPWLLLILFYRPSSKKNQFLISFTIAMFGHAAPFFLLLPLIINNPGPVSLMVISGLFMMLIAIFQACSLLELKKLQINSQKSVIVKYKELSEDRLLKYHIVALNKIWVTLLGLTTVMSIFFLVFLFIPGSLLEVGSERKEAKNARVLLEDVYNQRFLDHFSTFKMWCDISAEYFLDLQLLGLKFSENDPLYTDIKSFQKSEPYRAYISAINIIKDLILDSHPRLAEFSFLDVKAMLEILYRENLSEIEVTLTKLTKTIQSSKLDKEKWEDLPKWLKQNIPQGMRIPIPMSYRAYVEKGGFATGLKPLPNRDKMNRFTTFAESNRIETVSGFDKYNSALDKFDKIIGKTKLTIFGMEIPRSVVQKTTAVIILVFMFLIWLKMLNISTVIREEKIRERFRIVCLSIPNLIFLQTKIENLREKAKLYAQSILAFAWPLTVLWMSRLSDVGETNQRSFSMLVILLLATTFDILCIFQRIRIISKIS